MMILITMSPMSKLSGTNNCYGIYAARQSSYCSVRQTTNVSMNGVMVLTYQAIVGSSIREDIDFLIAHNS